MRRHLRHGVPLVLALAACAASAAPFAAGSADVAPGKPIGNKYVFSGFGCKGDNVSPEISWKNAPAGTKSFAVLVHDPDAPTGGAGFWHWLVVDLPASTTSLPQGAGKADGSGLPAGARQITTDFGAPGYGGPCPPTGDKPHRYNFTVYALKVEKLDLPPNPTASLTGFMVNANTLAKATFTGRYGR
ncbi:MAG TPA: YbhB/YbcL family Raf kinase inhibitor-like protein [Burkholderiaceae bacterium]|nr:YbhB/YbcL family Raf kinase inhibitor-like protein [Burkholderiaceae bacterium]